MDMQPDVQSSVGLAIECASTLCEVTATEQQQLPWGVEELLSALRKEREKRGGQRSRNEVCVCSATASDRATSTRRSECCIVMYDAVFPRQRANVDTPRCALSAHYRRVARVCGECRIAILRSPAAHCKPRSVCAHTTHMCTRVCHRLTAVQRQ